MKEISLNILDVVGNSIKAKAKRIDIILAESVQRDVLELTIKDDGCGMAPEFLARVTDPFTTTRTTRRVGLGLPLLKMAAEGCNGTFSIESTVNVGTCVFATFQLSHLDRMPLGNMPETIVTLIGADDKIRYVYTHTTDTDTFVMDTKEIQDTLGEEIPLSAPEILAWIKDFVKENLENIKGGNL
ncbi:MAG: sensor histidine kinase [Clostridia bacterium]|nr:sensor histidine kinase [Clostridia bacterium]